jgi:hypothetical protein
MIFDPHNAERQEKPGVRSFIFGVSKAEKLYKKARGVISKENNELVSAAYMLEGIFNLLCISKFAISEFCCVIMKPFESQPRCAKKKGSKRSV